MLGYGRDPLAPIKDAVTADGNVVVPIDAQGFGVWLKAAFGEPTTTGTAPGPFTHEFQSGGVGVAQPVHRDRHAGGAAVRDVFRLRARHIVLADAALGAADRDRQPRGAGREHCHGVCRGHAAELALQRFGHFNGAITRNGTALGNIVSAEITYANTLDRVETIRSDGRIDGADPSIAALTGRIEVRFADQVLVDQAINGDPCELSFGYTLPSGESLTLTAHAVYLPRPRIEIAGPQGVQATFDWQAARDSTLGRMRSIMTLGSVLMRVAPVAELAAYVGRRIILEMPGALRCRTITVAIDDGDDHRLTLSSPLGERVPLGTKVHFLTAMRADADRVEIQHGAVAGEVTLPVVEVTD